MTAKTLTSAAINTIKEKHLIGKGMTVGFSVMSFKGDYQRARQQGDSKLVSMAKGAASFAYYDMVGLWGIPIALAQGGVQGIIASGKNRLNITTSAYDNRGKLGSGYFDMNQAGYTMRQRSLNAIQQNGLNLNSALGNEARTYFRSSI